LLLPLLTQLQSELAVLLLVLDQDLVTMAQIVLFLAQVFQPHQLAVAGALVANHRHQHQSMVVQAVQVAVVVMAVQAEQGHLVKVILVGVEVGLVPLMAVEVVAVLVQ
jgi:hypothetical protein